MRWWRLVAAVATFAALGAPAAAESLGHACRTACAARNVPPSCRWLAAHPPRCLDAALRACRRAARAGGPVACPLPSDLPACLDDHACPFGSLCADGACQVVPCGACGAGQTCRGAQCVVGDCGAVDANCPSGFHCEPAAPPFDTISGTCAANDPSILYCTTGADCIVPGRPGLACVKGRCQSRHRRRGGRHGGATTTTTSSTTTTLGTTTTTLAPCGDVFDCPDSGTQACCAGSCVPDPYAGKGICSTLYTPACTLCASDNDCACNGIFCDSCGGTASLSGCVDPCAH
jgi:hypothetical protein